MRRAWAAAAGLGMLAAACRSSLVEIGGPTTVATEAASPVAPATASPQTPPAGPPAYAVAWVAEPLVVRQPAGITSSPVALLPVDQRGIGVTGASTRLGSSTWLEILLPGGGTGWVNAYNLTEDVQPEAFCQDPRPVELAERFIQAVQQENGLLLAQLASPKRGLMVRHDWWSREVVVEAGSLHRLFQETDPREWGVHRDSGLTIQGSFATVILPQLRNVFAAPPAYGCNRIEIGNTAEPISWPPEYMNLNYLSFHRTAPSPGSLNWRTWVLGIEYVEGTPYLAVLVQYRGEI